MLLKPLVSLGRYAMAAYLDFGVGTAVVALHALLAGRSFSLWDGLLALVFGGMFALLPDILDLLWPILREVFLGKKISDDYNHRTSFSHRPAILVPVAGVVAWALGGEFWAINAVVCLLLHYLHDMWPFSEGGIAWLWPVRKRFLTFRGFEALNFPIPPMETWMKENWHKPSFLALVEILIGSACFCVAVVLMTQNMWWGIAAFVVAPLGALFVWNVRHYVD